MKKVVLFLWLTLQYLGLAANPASFEAANQSYQNGDYTEAIQQYEALLGEDYLSADLHYNLGSAYFRKNELAKAVLHFEKAALLAPRDQSIQHNLDVIRKKLPDQLDVIPDFFVSKWWTSTQQLAGPCIWAGICLLIVWAGGAGFILWVRGKNRKLRKQGFILGLVLSILSFLPMALGFSAAKAQKHSGRAVLMAAETSLKSAPDEMSEDILTLHAGTSLILLDEIGEWKKIRLCNGEEGWLEVKSLEEI